MIEIGGVGSYELLTKEAYYWFIPDYMISPQSAREIMVWTFPNLRRIFLNDVIRQGKSAETKEMFCFSILICKSQAADRILIAISLVIGSQKHLFFI